eukprot:3679033-Pyramimonas_sp.AAC.1
MLFDGVPMLSQRFAEGVPMGWVVVSRIVPVALSWCSVDVLEEPQLSLLMLFIRCPDCCWGDPPD